jgi:hypothetical protein
MVADAGTASASLSLAIATMAPAAGAGWPSVIVQVPDPPGARLLGLQTRPGTGTGATRTSVKVWELLPNATVTVAL